MSQEIRILAIPDIHQKVGKARRIIRDVGQDCNRIVLLGDYFDDWNDTPKDTRKACLFLGDMQQDPKVICLLGNHDASYLHPAARCSGWSAAKQAVVDNAIRDEIFNRRRFLAFYATADLFFSHAGMAKGVDLGEQALAVGELLYDAQYDRVLDAHVLDGGTMDPAGLLWNRPQYNKISRYGGCFQVFGHTQCREPVVTEDWMCLDTGLNHVAVFTCSDDGKVSHDIIKV